MKNKLGIKFYESFTFEFVDFQVASRVDTIHKSHRVAYYIECLGATCSISAIKKRFPHDVNNLNRVNDTEDY